MGEWLKTGLYLPRVIRDFHDQKDVFKWIWRRIEARKGVDPSAASYLAGMTWTGAQVFVVDHFLWWMAMHGYTLQPTRNGRDDYASWDASIRAMKDEDAAAFRKMLDDDAAARAEQVSRNEQEKP